MRIGSRDSIGFPTGDGGARFMFAVVAPLAVVASAFALWWVTDRLLYVGPLDRAAFGWAVVVPVWLCAPIVAGLAWRRLGARATTAAAVVVGAVISSASAILFWQALAHPDCEYGATRTPVEWLVPSIVIGTAIGAGVGSAACLWWGSSGVAIPGAPRSPAHWWAWRASSWRSSCSSS